MALPQQEGAGRRAARAGVGAEWRIQRSSTRYRGRRCTDRRCPRLKELCFEPSDHRHHPTPLTVAEKRSHLATGPVARPPGKVAPADAIGITPSAQSLDHGRVGDHVHPAHWLAIDGVHQAAGGFAWRPRSLLPRAHGTWRNSHDFGENRLSATDSPPCLPHLLGSIVARFHGKPHSPAIELFYDVVPALKRGGRFLQRVGDDKMPLGGECAGKRD